MYDLIRKPVITEKSTMLSEHGKYTFKVSVVATKEEIKIAVEHIFAVKVCAVNVLNADRKKKRFKGREGYRAAFKKAVVTLEQGHNIDFNGNK